MAFGRRPASTPRPGSAETIAGYAGFSVAGYHAARGTLNDSDLRSHRARLCDDAHMARGLGGNLLRCFWSVEMIMTGPEQDLSLALNSVLREDSRHRSVYLQTPEERLAAADRINVLLDELLLAVDDRPESRFELDFSALDALFDGLDDANRVGPERVEMMLVLLCTPPRLIVEGLSDATLRAHCRAYQFASLWGRYVRFFELLHARLVARYARRPERTLRAIEIFNEPDYLWTPEEVKIEGGGEGLVNPLGKYVTELNLAQIPETGLEYRAFESTSWGYQEQDAPWTVDDRHSAGVLEFDWGAKLDWYVMCAAQLHSHIARAVKEEAERHGVEVLTVSGSVTHVNVDYLIRMRRGDPNAFTHIDRIGLHPYHWVNHDVWDDRFVGDDVPAGWPQASPRRYATSLCKRFDFLTMLRGGSGDTRVDAELDDVIGARKLWVTEFGIGSKVLQGVNAQAPELNRLIRPRGLVGACPGYPDVVWEDLWEAFVDQVDAPWLERHGVEGLLLYGLHELDRPGYDLHDDDRANLALLRSDGTPRLDRAVLGRVGGLLRAVGERSASETPTPAPPQDAPAAALYRRPWRSVDLSDQATNVTTMLSLEERRLLQWLTASYYRGAGAIVDAGPFVGGSTVPLAEGLRSAGATATIDVYDRFETEPYMNDAYFADEPRTVGGSFLPVFERTTEHVRDLVRVHAGDLRTHPWRGGPIEILFVDLAKSWELNDFIVRSFLPSLIPGRSIVVQQDFVFAGCPWVALTMEHLDEYFEPIGFAEWCSVVYLCTAQVPDDVAAVSAIPYERQLDLMDRTIARFRGYPRAVLECAKAALMIGHGDLVGSDAVLARLETSEPMHQSVRAAIDLVASFRPDPR